MEPTFDENGYPSEETLSEISEWPSEDAAGCLDFVAKAWHYQDFGVRRELLPHEENAKRHFEDGKAKCLVDRAQMADALAEALREMVNQFPYKDYHLSACKNAEEVLAEHANQPLTQPTN